MKELEKEIYDESNGLWHTLAEDGMYYPNLALPEQDNTWVGKYGLLRKHALKSIKTVDICICIFLVSLRNIY